MEQQHLSEKPEPHTPNECCESGCDPCVWDIYRVELNKWEQAQQPKPTGNNPSEQ